MKASENKGNGKYPTFSYVRNIGYAKLIISVKKRGCPKTKGVRKLGVITVTYESLNDIDDKTNAIGVYLFAIICDITSNLN